MDRLEIDNIIKLNELNDELEFERATSIYGKLRWMTEKDSSLKSIHKHLKSLITQYEKKHWGNESKISNEQIIESDIAEKIVNSENEFIQKRKKLIKGKLNEIGILQQDLADILGHRPNYMSELINGVRPFSRDDIVVLHRLFGIEFKDLIPQFLKSEVTNHIKLTLGKFKNSKIKLNIKDLETA
ncbi:MAG: helix-turn-helix domain-containing protein [Bacteroidales bacterium]|nr:helix-turn-helix domain-containing protein [Bacteroidales bacterium]